MFPSLEDHEKEILYQHPVEAIKCNQLGVLYCDEKVYGIYNKADSSMVRNQVTRKTFGTKPKVIWECYTGEIVTSPHFFYANANPLDLRFENMIHSKPLSAKERAPYIAAKSKFVKASVEHLMKLEDRMEKEGVGKEQLYDMLLLPYWLVAARGKYVPPRPKHQKVTSLGKSKPRSTEEEIEEVIRLFNQGQTFYAIIDRMGWTSTSRIKKIVQDHGLVR
jgi:hypothetical protein